MPHNAVLGRDFLVAIGANINFGRWTLKLHNTKPLKLSIKASHFQPVTSLLQVQESQPVYRNQEKDVDLAATLDHSLVQNSTQLLPQFKKAAVFFLKLLVILLLLSPYGLAATDNIHEVNPSKEIETQVAEVHSRTDHVTDIQNASPLTNVQAG